MTRCHIPQVIYSIYHMELTSLFKTKSFHCIFILIISTSRFVPAGECRAPTVNISGEHSCPITSIFTFKGLTTVLNRFGNLFGCTLVGSSVAQNRDQHWLRRKGWLRYTLRNSKKRKYTLIIIFRVISISYQYVTTYHLSLVHLKRNNSEYRAALPIFQ